MVSVELHPTCETAQLGPPKPGRQVVQAGQLEQPNGQAAAEMAERTRNSSHTMSDQNLQV